ncbi:MAG TPA: thioesterase family protein [Candidatus Dormibacteraeota bacterium]|nr:thioesterase family protein [Candidatus Dormibacteraeota bacterium]
MHPDTAGVDDATGPAAISVERRIEWGDTDASGHYHYAAALRLFESAETTLLERLGLRDLIYARLPRVGMRIEFREWLVFGDIVTVGVRVEQMGRTSVTYAFTILRDAKTCASGEVTAVLLKDPLGRPTPWPDEYRARLSAAGPQASECLSPPVLERKE